MLFVLLPLMIQRPIFPNTPASPIVIRRINEILRFSNSLEME
jgi:hypothetical protein